MNARTDDAWVGPHGGERTRDVLARCAEIVGIDPAPRGGPRSVGPE